jgi:hypothetical protein
MGQSKDQLQKARERGKGRGSVKNSARLAAFGRGASSGEASWRDCECSLLQAVVVTITALGGAITFGLSRDQGAYSLSLILDDHRETLWFNGGSDLDDELKSVLGKLEAIE